MSKGVHLTLLVGPAVPVPAPQVVIDALTRVEVTTSTSGPSGFQLQFQLDARSPLHTLFLVAGGGAIPLIRVMLVVTINGTPEVIMDGVMTDHQVTPGDQRGQATLTVTGEDLTKAMDYVELDGFPFPAMPPETRVLAILAKYALFGVIPIVVPTLFPDVPNPLARIPRQKGTDLCYIRQLAQEAGYVFYVTPGPAPGVNTAYWGPEVRVGVPQPALNVNMDAHTNCESLTFRFASEDRVQPIVFIQEPFTKAPIPIPVPDISPLNPPLGIVPPLPKRFEVMQDTSKLSMGQALLRSIARASQTSNAATASGSLDVLRYGRILKARQLVGVRGVGPAFNGLYFVESVTHEISRGKYKQNFELSRNGLVSTVPRVPA
jgi:hypothetical protein